MEGVGYDWDVETKPIVRRKGAQMADAMSWEMLNATADDWESLDQLYLVICRFRSPVSRATVIEAAAQLETVGFLEQRVADAPASERWFRMTGAGHVAWQEATDKYAR